MYEIGSKCTKFVTSATGFVFLDFFATVKILYTTVKKFYTF